MASKSGTSMPAGRGTYLLLPVPNRTCSVFFRFHFFLGFLPVSTGSTIFCFPTGFDPSSPCDFVPMYFDVFPLLTSFNNPSLFLFHIIRSTYVPRKCFFPPGFCWCCCCCSCFFPKAGAIGRGVRLFSRLNASGRSRLRQGLRRRSLLAVYLFFFPFWFPSSFRRGLHFPQYYAAASVFEIY